jgi:predicted dehydrogenase
LEDAVKNKAINVALVGHRFMGKAHSHAYRDVAMFFPEVAPRMRVLCGVGDDLDSTAKAYGWERTEPSWQKVVEDPEVDVVDICTPDRLHREVALAAARNGKHVFCEKPLALSLKEAREMHECARDHGVVHMVNFVYRGVPAVQLAKKLIGEGKIGKVLQFKGLYQQDFSLSESFPFVWRMDRAEAGHGVLADKGAHVIDLARFLVGEFESVACRTQTFVKERRVQGSGEMRTVTTNDAAAFLASFAGGALGTFELSNMCAGSKNALQFEVSGSLGSIRFDLERLNELEVYLASDPEEVRGFRKILVTSPSHPYVSHWWPEGHVLGWEHGFVHMVREMLEAVSQRRPATPSFLDGMKCQEVVDALAAADQARNWVSVGDLR